MMISQLKRVFAGFAMAFSLATAVAEDPTHLHQISDDINTPVQATGISSAKSLLSLGTPPEDITTTGHHIDWLFQYLTAVELVFFILVIVGLVGFSIAYRARPGHRAHYILGYGKKEIALISLLALAVFVSLDIVAEMRSHHTMKNVMWNFPKGEDVVKVMVMPQQWAWNFRYQGTDGKFNTPDDVVMLNHLYVPKGKKVMLEIMSRDVIHGFWIPVLRRQVDALPGSVNRMWFDTTRTGDFELACAHLCGTAHYKMKGFLNVVEPEQFDAWHKERSEYAAIKFDPTEKSSQWGWIWSSN